LFYLPLQVTNSIKQVLQKGPKEEEQGNRRGATVGLTTATEQLQEPLGEATDGLGSGMLSSDALLHVFLRRHFVFQFKLLFGIYLGDFLGYF